MPVFLPLLDAWCYWTVAILMGLQWCLIFLNLYFSDCDWDWLSFPVFIGHFGLPCSVLPVHILCQFFYFVFFLLMWGALYSGYQSFDIYVDCSCLLPLHSLYFHFMICRTKVCLNTDLTVFMVCAFCVLKSPSHYHKDIHPSFLQNMLVLFFTFRSLNHWEYTFVYSIR